MNVNKEQEDTFVDAFITSGKRERYKQFLANLKKRRIILDRLNHSLDFVALLAKKADEKTVFNNLRAMMELQCVKLDDVYIFSDDAELDGVFMPLDKALHEVNFSYSGSVVCCIKGKLAYYKPEAPSAGYILDATDFP